MAPSSIRNANSESRTKLIILNAGVPYDSDMDDAVSLAMPVHGQRTLDWVLDATNLATDNVSIVSGYRTPEMRAQFSDIHVIENKEWRVTGSAGSLFCADLDDISELLVCYGDILFRENIVQQLCASEEDLTIAWDSKFRTRYADREVQDLERCEKVIAQDGTIYGLGENLENDWATGEFIGLVRFTGASLSRLAGLSPSERKTLAGVSLASLVEWFRLQGHVVNGCDVAGDWAEHNEAHDIAHFVLGTKAESLERLRRVVKSSVIQPQFSFSVASWEDDPTKIIEEIRAATLGPKIIIRSSAKSEDSFLHSNAGAYTSLLNIDPQDDLTSPIDEVCASYENKQDDDQILVQPMVSNVTMSGVAFTRSLDFGAPYYVINYVEGSETDAITAGKDAAHVTYIIRRDIELHDIPEPHLRTLHAAISEIEYLLNYDALDIEFAIDAAAKVHILQVRPITVKNASIGLTHSCLSMARQAEKKWKNLSKARPQIKGDSPIYGVMPDWNPAEIIGTNAGLLSVSLYQSLITDNIWAQQRAEYGYKDVRPQPLLVNFCGKNYVDVRASFNSFIPENISEDLHTRLANVYLKRLQENPEAHDKVEFDILPTCLSLAMPDWRKTLAAAGIDDTTGIDALEHGLRQITQNAFDRTSFDMAAAASVAEEYNSIADTFEPASLERAVHLLDVCRLRGTLPFAHLARSGFVAVTLLKDAVACGVLSKAAQDAFLASIRTVSHEMVHDAAQVAVGEMPWEEFVACYGHLRPGTYDIRSPAYTEAPEQYLRPMIQPHSQDAAKIDDDLDVWDAEKGKFFDAIAELGIKASGEEVELFLRQAIQGREKSKFIFTRYLSLALDDIRLWGASHGLSRELVSHLHLNDLQEIIDKPRPIKKQIKALRKAASTSAKTARVSAACQLPELITGQKDFRIFRLREGQPNYIGTGEITGNAVVLGDQDTPVTLEGCIVMVPQADPGYDWLFGQKIGGLITMYGGANSHMAIRAAEFSLPAAIGVGEKLYQSFAKARILELSPRNKTVRVVA